MAARKRKAAPALDPKAAKKLADEGWEAAPGGGTAESLSDGDVAVGVFQGLENTNFTRDDGEPARVLVLDTPNGQIKYWAPTILQSRVETFNPGDEVRIECLGKGRTGNGRNAWMFDVRVKRHSPAKAVDRVGRSATVKRKPVKRTKAKR